MRVVLRIYFLSFIIGCFFFTNVFGQENGFSVGTFSATKFNRLTGTNKPEGLREFEKLEMQACAGETEPVTLLLESKKPVKDIKIEWTDFSGKNGKFDAGAMNIYIAKVWYQAGVTAYEVNNKLLTQELLIKNDSLVKVDLNTETNYLLARDPSGNLVYLDISTPTTPFPMDVTIKDSPVLLPFSLDGKSNKQLWLSVKIPDDTKPGIYTSTITILTGKNTLRKFSFDVEVLPFKLDESRLTYGIYYMGRLDSLRYKKKPFYIYTKSKSQLMAELRDLKDHGITHPTIYQFYDYIDEDLKIRKQLGFPTDRLFQMGLRTGNAQTKQGLDSLRLLIRKWKKKSEEHGYKELFIYGLDEAKNELLRSEIPAWKVVHEEGAKVFVAANHTAYMLVDDLLDVAIIRSRLDPKQAAYYHAHGNKIYSYANPHTGEENPEIYRRNYGLALWKAGYDGYMDYAYQKSFNYFWNDFDDKFHREETFTYPASNGVILTIQWEGMREAIDDVRYISTLLNKIDALKAKGKDVSELEKWVQNVDPSGDLDVLRKQIVEKIISIEN